MSTNNRVVALAEALKNLQTELTAWKNVARQAGVCMSCALGAPDPHGCTDCLGSGWEGGAPAGFIPDLPREPGTCKCGAAPINKDGMCATCADEEPAPAPLWRAFHAMAWPKLWGIETTDPRAVEAGLEILVAPCMPEHAAKTLSDAYNFAVSMRNPKPEGKGGDRPPTAFEYGRDWREEHRPTRRGKK